VLFWRNPFFPLVDVVLKETSSLLILSSNLLGFILSSGLLSFDFFPRDDCLFFMAILSFNALRKVPLHVGDNVPPFPRPDPSSFLRWVACVIIPRT